MAGAADYVLDSFPVVVCDNSRRKDEPHIRYIKETMRKNIETSISLVKAKMLRNIHTVTMQGFLLKVALFVISFTFEKLTINWQLGLVVQTYCIYALGNSKELRLHVAKGYDLVLHAAI